MNRTHLWAALLLLALAVAGCGQKGDLYLPEQGSETRSGGN